MKKKVLAGLLTVAMAASMLVGCGGKDTTADAPAATDDAATDDAATDDAATDDAATDDAATDDAAGDTASSDIKIALITMDSIDQYWLNLLDGAMKEAHDKGVQLDFNAPNTKDDAQQIECVNNAVANGYNAIMVAANGPDAISGALKDAIAADIKVVYVDSPANVEAEATYSTDNVAAGKTAGEEMIKALSDKGITSGDIGIINVNTATQSCVDRETGFRSAFDGSDFNLLETQYCDGDAAKSQEAAQNYVTQGVVGLFGCNEGSTTGAGNAIKASGNADIIGVGFDTSDSIKSLIKDGYLVATMSQKPDEMGKLGVDACIDAINGTSHNGEVVDTGVEVLTKDNIE